MEKRKRWQLYLIFGVLALTLYNILPTIFYYSHPLSSPIDEKRAEEIAEEISYRTNRLEEDAIAWVHSFSNLIGIKPVSVLLNEANPETIQVTFTDAKEKKRFENLASRAGTMIPFVPAQLSISSLEAKKNEEASPLTLLIERKIPVHLDTSHFSFIAKQEADNKVDAAYLSLLEERVENLIESFDFNHPLLEETLSISDTKDKKTALSYSELLLFLQENLKKSPLLEKRFWNNFLSENKNPSQILAKLQTKLIAFQEQSEGEEKKKFAEVITLLSSKEKQILQKQESDKKSILAGLGNNFSKVEGNLVTIPLHNRSLFVDFISVDPLNDRIILSLFPDVQFESAAKASSEKEFAFQEKLNVMLFNSLGETARASHEEIKPFGKEWQISLSSLQNSSGFIALDLKKIAKERTAHLLSRINLLWNPVSADFRNENYPVRPLELYLKEDSLEQKVGIVLFTPQFSKKELPEGLDKSAFYVVLRNAKWIQEKNREGGKEKEVENDLDRLSTLLQEQGFIQVNYDTSRLDKQFAQDILFEQRDFFLPLLKATRENFEVKGGSSHALLPVSTVEERIMTWNRIEDSIQEDLLKWRDEYNQSQVDLNPSNRYLVPKPTTNPLLANLLLSTKKYYRGDERKILKWGLDLSGGKMVRIALVDKNGRRVTNPDDLKQALNELYTRVNNMGIQERSVYIENNHIILEFPGSQAISAKELVSASAMYFHVVNEKFGPYNDSLKTSVQQFLQEVWNEAAIKEKTSVEEINEIARRHLGQGRFEIPTALSESAKRLKEAGLNLADPKYQESTNGLDEEYSRIALLKEEAIGELSFISHPLIIVFNNYALEGSNLTNVDAGYDTQEGNHLTFGVKNSYEVAQKANGVEQSGSPRESLYNWTSQFAEDKIQGTERELFSGRRGWRMAVILNGQIISMPSLKSPLRDRASITGRFTQREVSKLVADLKAGSLSFTPKILSEENISAELGKEERLRGIGASILAAVLVAVAMIGYYRFAGVVATVAVFINILIMWGVLQNLHAALTLPGIAGIVLTIGMAVDANVLVFERIREEFALSGRIGSAIQAGYKKAFSAIVDSNITTIIAAFILIQFDSGPIKGFAMTLIIGIFSSMFTALFMTKVFFQGWVQNPKNRTLTLSNWIGAVNFDFLSKAKAALLISVIALAIGGYAFWHEKGTLLGMDFRGGWSLVVNVENSNLENNAISPRQIAIQALNKAGASYGEFDVRELNSPSQLQISLSRGLEESNGPFAAFKNQSEGMMAEGKDPRLSWTLQALEKGGLDAQGESSGILSTQWSSVSGQFSETMAKNGLYGLLIAFLAILAYIAIRFEFIFALAAVAGLVHDVLITVGIIALLHGFGWNIHIDLETLGAIMTIIGYSLNDTIIVFDRIREDMKLHKRKSLYDVINHSLNVTLSRTLMTSGTTLLVLLSLVLFGGSSIFGFSLVMTIGVIVGTLSSLFIASPLLLFLEDWQKARQTRNETLRHSD